MPRDLLAPATTGAPRDLLAQQPQAAPEPSFMKRLADAYVRGRQQLQPVQQQALSDLASPGKAVGALNDMARIAADTATFGFADPAISAITGEDERAKTQEARERAGWAGTGMDVATAVAATPSLVARAPQVIGGFGRALGYGAEAGGQAALSAYGHGERDVGEIGRQAITGAGLGAGASATGGRIGTWAERRRARAAQPFKEAGEVKSAGKAKYKEVEAAGGHYPAPQTDTLLAQLDAAMIDEDVTAGLDDRTIAVVNKLKKDWAGKDMSPTQLDKVRRWIDKKLIRADPRSDQALLGYRLKDEIDNFTRSNPVLDAAGVPDPAINATLEEGRSLYARSKRSEAVEGARDKAKKQARTTGSAITGGNIENTTRQQFGKLQEKIEAGKAGGYSPEETARIGEITEGTKMRDLGRIGGAVSPFRGAVPALAAVMSGGLLAPIGIAGEAAAQIGQRLTRREVDELAALVRDPSGRGIAVDPAAINRLRDLLARSAASGYRAPQPTQR